MLIFLRGYLAINETSQNIYKIYVAFKFTWISSYILFLIFLYEDLLTLGEIQTI